MQPYLPFLGEQINCAAQPTQTILQHELQFYGTMVASDAALFYLYFAHSTSSLFKLTMKTAAARESFMGGQQYRM